MYWEVDVNISFNFSGGESMSYSAERTRTWTHGMNKLFDKSDYQYQIDGSSNGNFANGELFTVEITNPIVYKINCWLANSCAKVSGVKKLLLEIKTPELLILAMVSAIVLRLL